MRPTSVRAGKGINIKSANGNQQALVQMATEDLSRSIEAVLCAAHCSTRV